jgi:hypothetical protein
MLINMANYANEYTSILPISYTPQDQEIYKELLHKWLKKVRGTIMQVSVPQLLDNHQQQYKISKALVHR